MRFSELAETRLPVSLPVQVPTDNTLNLSVDREFFQAEKDRFLGRNLNLAFPCFPRHLTRRQYLYQAPFSWSRQWGRNKGHERPLPARGPVIEHPQIQVFPRECYQQSEIVPNLLFFSFCDDHASVGGFPHNRQVMRWRKHSSHRS